MAIVWIRDPNPHLRLGVRNAAEQQAGGNEERTDERWDTAARMGGNGYHSDGRKGDLGIVARAFEAEIFTNFCALRAQTEERGSQVKLDLASQRGQPFPLSLSRD